MKFRLPCHLSHTCTTLQRITPTVWTLVTTINQLSTRNPEALLLSFLCEIEGIRSQ
ncbi:hypothetical protein [Spirosoma sp.]|uniref:hypothetical protein n=1 Tax=Spirosoma sp. TaxID=1899569 RepID=UPI003B3B4A70